MRLIIFLVVIAGALARRPPNADYVQNMAGTRVAAEVLEDASLDVPSLIRKYGYPVEVHNVVTSDGYILEMHRIPHGREQTHGPRIPVLVMHGLLSSSADWVTMGPNNALGYILADAGYDVWMGNARGNFYSRRHNKLNPDSFLNKDFWRFSWDEIGNHDLPAFVDLILARTGQKKLHYIGHSQGGTTFVVLNSLRPEYNAKFISFQGLAPAVFFDYNEDSMYNRLAKYESVLESMAFTLNAQEIFGNRDFINKHCVAGSIFSSVCEGALSGLHNSPYYNSTMLPIIEAHTPAGAAIRQVAHYGQVIKYKAFRRFNHNSLTNKRLYGSFNPPAYDVTRVTVPSYLYYGLNDVQVDYRDLMKLANTLPNLVTVNQARRVTFNHFDFMWAIDVREMVYDRMVDAMKDAEQKFL